MNSEFISTIDYFTFYMCKFFLQTQIYKINCPLSSRIHITTLIDATINLKIFSNMLQVKVFNQDSTIIVDSRFLLRGFEKKYNAWNLNLESIHIRKKNKASSLVKHTNNPLDPPQKEWNKPWVVKISSPSHCKTFKCRFKY